MRSASILCNPLTGMTKHFCPIPFHHLAIRPDGQVFPCCFFRQETVPKDFNLNHPDLFNHPYLTDIRNKLRNDEPVEGCKLCYENEKLSGSSMRIDYIKSEYLGFKDQPPLIPELTYIDLALSNVCNNRCRMCGPELSTNWYQDAKKLNLPIPSGLIKHENTLDNYDLSKLTYMKLIGGEPLMEQVKFKKVLQKCNLQNLVVLITTNATVLPDDELLNLLNRCKKVKWLLSIDSFGPLNDFLRKGSEWNKVVDNIKYYYNNFPKNLNVHSVASIYNINVLSHLPEFLNKEFPNVIQKYVVVDGPDWMSPRHLPEHIKPELTKKLIKENRPYTKILLNEINQIGDIHKFIGEDKKLNSIRNESWHDINPELYRWLKEYYE